MHDPALYNLGYAYHRVGNIEQAIKSYRAGIQLNQRNPSAECHFNLACALYDNHEIDEALSQFKLCHLYDSENIDCILKIAGILEDKHQQTGDKTNLGESYAFYRKAFKIDPGIDLAHDGM